MTSQCFRKSKRLRAKTSCVQKEIRFIKQSRCRKIRRSVRMKLKASNPRATAIRYLNDGSWKIV